MAVDSPQTEFYRQRTRIFELRPTITAGAYSAADNVGGLQTISDVVNFPGRGGFIHSVSVIDAAAQSPQINLIFFNANPSASTITDNAAFVIHDDDLDKVVGHIPIVSADYLVAEAGTHIASARNLGLTFDTTPETSSGAFDGTNDLWVAAYLVGAPTFAATDDLILKIGVLQG